MKRISGLAVKIKIHINYYIKLDEGPALPVEEKMKKILNFFIPITPPGYP